MCGRTIQKRRKEVLNAKEDAQDKGEIDLDLPSHRNCLASIQDLEAASLRVNMQSPPSFFLWISASKWSHFTMREVP